MKRLLHRSEDAVVSLVLVTMVTLPLLAMGARALSSPAFAWAETILRHLNLWLAFLGALVAAREGRLLKLALRDLLPEGRGTLAVDGFATFIATAVTALLARASYDLVQLEKEFETPILDWLPVWVALVVLPLALGGIALRLSTIPKSWWQRAAGFLGIAVGLWIGAQEPEVFEERSALPAIATMVIATLCGAPLYVVLGGSAVVLFLTDGLTGAVVPSEFYRLAINPFLAALPLFTLAGYLLTLGKTPERLLKVFRAWFGWMPGGMPIVVLFLCTFFTVFTGGSGVTILALGGLLLPALVSTGYSERFSLGLLTASGSLGLLFPPALPLILYGIAAEVPIEDLFLGGLLPGMLLLGVLVLYGLGESRRASVGERIPFDGKEALRALWQAKFELALPVIALTSIFGGFATIVEAAALTAAAALIGQVLFHRKDIKLLSDVLPTLKDCAAVLGGVMILLTVAMGLTNWFVDAQIPSEVLEWVRSHVDSRVGFLLSLNVFLLLVGCFLDIYSATFVVVPLILPLGEAYDIHPIHLGIIFVANLELGYLTPPIGLNLFLASYRFDKPLGAVYRATWPFLVIMGIGVLAITYLPFLSTAFLGE